MKPRVTGFTSPSINLKRINSLKFEHTGHKYTYRGRETKLSTTGFIKQFFPGFDNSSAIEKIRSRPGSAKELLYRNMTDDEIKKRWKDNGEIASGKGTILHEMIELSYLTGFEPGWRTFSDVRDYCIDRLNRKEVGAEEPEQEMVGRWYKTLTHESYEEIESTLEEYEKETGWVNFYSFRQILNNTGQYEAVMPEVKIHTDEQISGMVDMLYRNKKTGKYLICDWKRSKHLRDKGYGKGYGPCSDYPNSDVSKYTLQVTFYSWALRKYYNIDVTEAWILGFHPKDSTFTLISVDINMHIPTIERMLEKLFVTIYLPAMNYTNITTVKYMREGMKRRTIISQNVPSITKNSIILSHKDEHYGFSTVEEYLTKTPLPDMPVEIYVPYLCGYVEDWTPMKQNIYKEGFPLNITFTFVLPPVQEEQICR